MKGYVVSVTWSTVVWVALWGRLTVANVLGGLAVGIVATLLVPPRSRPGRTIRPVALLRFVGHFVYKLVEASVIVAWEVATPHNRINEGIVAIELSGAGEWINALVADLVSLTPGTLTLEVQHDTLYVHVLHLDDLDAVRRDVLLFEELAIRAFVPSASHPPATSAQRRTET
jgi:multicomponent Na+:H+ antiporter subunit E